MTAHRRVMASSRVTGGRSKLASGAHNTVLLPAPTEEENRCKKNAKPTHLMLIFVLGIVLHEIVAVFRHFSSLVLLLGSLLELTEKQNVFVLFFLRSFLRPVFTSSHCLSCMTSVRSPYETAPRRSQGRNSLGQVSAVVALVHAAARSRREEGREKSEEWN